MGHALRIALAAAVVLTALSASAHSQPAGQQNSVQYCPTGATDGFGNPVVAPCGYAANPVVVLANTPGQIGASAVGTTAATTATLTGAANVTTYICGFTINAAATAAASGNATVTGTIGGTLNYNQNTPPLASGVGSTNAQFNPCIPATAPNTAIAVVSAAPGPGGVVSVAAWGYRR